MADASFMLLHPATSLGSVVTEARLYLHVNTNATSRVLHRFRRLPRIPLNTRRPKGEQE